MDLTATFLLFFALHGFGYLGVLWLHSNFMIFNSSMKNVIGILIGIELNPLGNHSTTEQHLQNSLNL